MLNNSRLVQLLKSISPQEQRLLQRFVASPIYNTNEKVKDLLHILKKISSGFTKDIPKVKVYNALFKKKIRKNAFDKEASRNLNGIMNRLFKVVEEFIVFQELNDKTVLKKRLLVQGLLRRNLFALGRTVLNSAREYLDETTEKDWRRFYDDFLIYESETHYNLITKSYQNNVGFQEMVDSFRRYCISGLMRFYCAAISREDIVNTTYDFPLHDYLERYIEENEEDHVPATCIYYYLLKLLRGEGDEKSFDNLMDLLYREGEFFPKEELRQVYRLVQNFCLLSVRAGHFQYRQPMFHIYENTLDSNIWYDKTYFKKETFIHIVRNALDVGEIAWASKFISDYQSKLNPDYTEETVFLAKAYFKNAEEEYDEAIAYLYKIDTQSVAFNLYIRKLEILVSYDATPEGAHLKKIEALEGCINKLRYYLDQGRRRTRSPVSDKILNSYRDFHKLVRRLYGQKYAYGTPNLSIISNIREDLEKLDLVEERFWLLEKLNELNTSNYDD